MSPDYCNRSPCGRITLLRTPSCLSVTHRTKSQPHGLAHDAAPHLAPASFQGSLPSLGSAAAMAGSLPASSMVQSHVPHKGLCCFFPFICHILPASFSPVLLFYQDSAKTSLPESQVSLSFSGFLYILVLTSLD